MKKYADTYPITKRDYSAIKELIESIEDRPEKL